MKVKNVKLISRPAIIFFTACYKINTAYKAYNEKTLYIERQDKLPLRQNITL